MEVEASNKPTEKQQNIFDHCSRYDGLEMLKDVYMDYTDVYPPLKCSRDYFISVVSTRWAVFKDDGNIWIDFNSPLDELWKKLESSFQTS